MQESSTKYKIFELVCESKHERLSTHQVQIIVKYWKSKTGQVPNSTQVVLDYNYESEYQHSNIGLYHGEIERISPWL